jgi:hypothetical protein
MTAELRKVILVLGYAQLYPIFGARGLIRVGAQNESPFVKTPALTAPGGRGSAYLDESPRPETEPRLSGAVNADFSHHP